MDDKKKEEIINFYGENEMKELKKICDPIIRKKFVPQSEYDDLYSTAMVVLMNTVESFDDTRGASFKTYLTNAINKRFFDWTRDKRRNKRCPKEKNEDGELVVMYDVSLDEMTEDGIDLIERVDCGFDIEAESGLYNESVEEFLAALPAQARKVIELKMDGAKPDAIKKELGLTESEYNKCIAMARTSEKLELFTENGGGEFMYEAMEIDTTDQYRTDKVALGTLLDEKRDKKISCTYILQRKPFQWMDRQVNKYLTRVLNNQPIPEIVICEHGKREKKKKHLIDGLQRLSYASLYRADGYTITMDGAEYYNIKYQETVRDKNGMVVMDEDGDAKMEVKTINVIGKKFSELPQFLRDRFNKFNVSVTTYFDCTDEQIAYHIRNYNNHQSMNKDQYEITNISIEVARMIKDISGLNPFFKDRIGAFTDKNASKGALERVVVESLMATNFLWDWKKAPKEIYSYIDENFTKEMFDDLNETFIRMCGIVDKSNRKWFSTTNTYIWAAVFSKFKTLGLKDSMFRKFMDHFIAEFYNIELHGEKFSETYKCRNTKDKTIVIAKVNGITELMMDFLHVSDSVAAEEPEEETANNVVAEVVESPAEEDEPVVVDFAGFISNAIQTDVDEVTEDMECFVGTLNDLFRQAGISDSKIADIENRPSMLAMVAYSYKIDDDLDNWLAQYAKGNDTYLGDQMENFLHMKSDFEKYRENRNEKISA